MNTRAPEPRNFWGLTVQSGPWKTTSVDQTHLAQGYDSPHNNRQFVSPYQQDGTATIPDQQYTRLSIIEPSSDLQFKNGKIKKAKKGFNLNIIPEGFLKDVPTTETLDVEMFDSLADTTRPIVATNFPFKKTPTPEVAMDENAAANASDNPANSDLIGATGNGGNSVVELINQSRSSTPEQLGFAQNSWTQPANILETRQRRNTGQIIAPPLTDKMEVFDPETANIRGQVEVDKLERMRSAQTRRGLALDAQLGIVRASVAANAALK